MWEIFIRKIPSILINGIISKYMKHSGTLVPVTHRENTAKPRLRQKGGCEIKRTYSSLFSWENKLMFLHCFGIWQLQKTECLTRGFYDFSSWFDGVLFLFLRLNINTREQTYDLIKETRMTISDYSRDIAAYLYSIF